MTNSERKQSSGTLPLRLAAVCGAAITVFAMYPGMMMWDSLDQWMQARDGRINDWSPPLMTALWMWLDRAWPGPLPMLLMQTALLWTGGYLVLRAVPRVSMAVRALVLPAAFLMPPVLVVMGFITKDSLMAGLLCLAFGVAATAHGAAQDGTPGAPFRAWPWQLFGLLLVLASGMRYNAGGAVWAAAAYACYVGGSGALRFVRSLGLGLVATVACLCVSTALNGWLTDQSTSPWKSVAAYDIAGVARQLRTMDFIAPADLDALAGEAPGGEWTLARMQMAEADWNHLEQAGAHVEAGPVLRRVWLGTIRQHPAAYVANRAHMFGLNLRVSGDGPSQCLVMTPYTGVRNHTADEVPALFHFDYTLTPAQKRLRDRLAALAYNTKLFWPGVYLCAAVVALVWGGWLLAAGNALPFFLALSGVAQQATLFVLAPAVNFRYSHWLITATWLALLLLGADAASRLHPRRSA